jgi:hypothetical protein
VCGSPPIPSFVAVANIEKIGRKADFFSSLLVVIGDMPQRYGWTVFSSTQQLIDAGRAFTTSCIAPNERRGFSLPDEPPDWCVELHKQPYQSAEWQSAKLRRSK